MGIYKKKFGQEGESLACDYLLKQGLKIVERNFQTRYGEIDIIAEDRDITCFIEVKSRTSDMYGSPMEAVDIYKQKTIISIAKNYVLKNNLWDTQFRFDVISIVFVDDDVPKIEFIKDAFDVQNSFS